jgi:hypothetical protein
MELSVTRSASSSARIAVSSHSGWQSPREPSTVPQGLTWKSRCLRGRRGGTFRDSPCVVSLVRGFPDTAARISGTLCPMSQPHSHRNRNDQPRVQPSQPQPPTARRALRLLGLEGLLERLALQPLPGGWLWRGPRLIERLWSRARDRGLRRRPEVPRVEILEARALLSASFTQTNTTLNITLNDSTLVTVDANSAATPLRSATAPITPGREPPPAGSASAERN